MKIIFDLIPLIIIYTACFMLTLAVYEVGFFEETENPSLLGKAIINSIDDDKIELITNHIRRSVAGLNINHNVILSIVLVEMSLRSRLARNIEYSIARMSCLTNTRPVKSLGLAQISKRAIDKYYGDSKGYDCLDYVKWLSTDAVNLLVASRVIYGIKKSYNLTDSGEDIMKLASIYNGYEKCEKCNTLYARTVNSIFSIMQRSALTY